MRHWGLKSWRHAAVPLAAVSLVTAIGFSWGQFHAEVSDAGDPTVTSQAAIFVVTPNGDQTFQPAAACNATSLGQNRCTAAVFTVDDTPENLDYSDTPCQAQTATQLGINGLVVEDGDSTEACTASAFLPASGGHTAIQDFPGASCLPESDFNVGTGNAGPCHVFMELQQHDGHFNAPGLCSQNYYLNSPCTAAVVDTEGATGGDDIDFSSDSCPQDTNLSEPPIGSIQNSCTNLPFKAGGLQMTLDLPENATPAPAVNPQHSASVEDQAETLILAPEGQYTFQPSNSCSYDGLNPPNRCLAAILDVPVDGGEIDYSDNSCDLHEYGPVDPCTALPFSVSMGETAIHDYPEGTVCTAPLPAAQPNMTEVPCQIYVMLTTDDGNFNAGGLCSSFTNISSACALGVVDDSDYDEGDTVDLSSDACPTTGEDGDPGIVIHDSCSSPAFQLIPDMSVRLPEDPVVGD